jgi:hypothetical protein
MSTLMPGKSGLGDKRHRMERVGEGRERGAGELGQGAAAMENSGRGTTIWDIWVREGEEEDVLIGDAVGKRA